MQPEIQRLEKNITLEYIRIIQQSYLFLHVAASEQE